jgi:hypothetical protein
LAARIQPSEGAEKRMPGVWAAAANQDRTTRERTRIAIVRRGRCSCKQCMGRLLVERAIASCNSTPLHLIHRDQRGKSLYLRRFLSRNLPL